MKKKIISTILAMVIMITPVISSYAWTLDEAEQLDKEWADALGVTEAFKKAKTYDNYNSKIGCKEDKKTGENIFYYKIPYETYLNNKDTLETLYIGKSIESKDGIEYEYAHIKDDSIDTNAENLVIDGSKYGIINGSALRYKYFTNMKTLTVTEGAYDFDPPSSNTLEEIILPETIIGIGDMFNKFSGCPKLKKINIPSKIKHLYHETFSYCYDLESIDLNNVQFISIMAFHSCESLTSVKMNKVQYIGEDAFTGCDSLEEVTLPETLEYIHPNAFDGSVKRFFVTKGSYAEQWCIDNNYTFVNGIDENGNFACYKPYYGGSYWSYLNGVHNIYDEAVDGIVYNEDKTEILDYDAFKKDKEFTIPDGVKIAEINNDYLEKLTLNDEIERLITTTPNLKDVYLPNNFECSTFNTHLINKFENIVNNTGKIHFSVKSKMFESVFDHTYEDYAEQITKGITTFDNVKGWIGIISDSNNYDVYDIELLDVEVEPEPTVAPTDEPTVIPTDEPTTEPTAIPTIVPVIPTIVPTIPAIVPTIEPTTTPIATAVPTTEPIVTVTPTAEPTTEPTEEPVATVAPTTEPTEEPVATVAPTAEPTIVPVVCDSFNDKVSISINPVTLNSDETGLEILIDTLDSSIDIGKVTVYGTAYDENGNLVKISVFERDGNAFVGNIADCKLMIWYDGLQPMINSLNI